MKTVNKKNIGGILYDFKSIYEKAKEASDQDKFLGNFIPAAKMLHQLSSTLIYSINSDEAVIPKIIIKFEEDINNSNISDSYSRTRNITDMKNAFAYIEKITEIIQFSINEVSFSTPPFFLKNYFYYTVFFDENENLSNFSACYYRTIVPIQSVIIKEKDTLEYFDSELNKASYNNKSNDNTETIFQYRKKELSKSFFNDRERDTRQKLNFI